MAGAFTAVAEGGDGVVSNIAAAAHRPHDTTSNFGVDLLFTMGAIPSTDRQDLDNDGRIDRVSTTLLLGLGVRVQAWRFGMAYHGRALGPSHCLVEGADITVDCPRSIQVAQTYSVLGGAVNLFEDQLVVGAGWLRASGGVLTFEGTPRLNEEVGRAVGEGGGVDLGVLYRPRSEPFRIGASFRSQVRAPMNVERGAAAQFFDRAVYRGIVMPASASIGLSWKFLEGAEHYNAPSPVAATPAVEPLPEEKRGRLLLSAQLDGIFPVRSASGASAFIGDVDARPVATAFTLTPRVGVEHLTIVRRLRLRGGAYLEPSLYEGVSPRPHATAGFDLFLFEAGLQWTLKGYADLSRGFQSYGVSVGSW